MEVEARYFGREPLLPLAEAAKRMSPRRTKTTLWNWHSQGFLNQSGRPVQLRVTRRLRTWCTSLEEIGRFLKAVTARTVAAVCIGGSLHGSLVHIADDDEELTSEDVADQLSGRIVPANETYVPTRFIDSHGKPRTFLIHKPDLEQGRGEAIKILQREL